MESGRTVIRLDYYARRLPELEQERFQAWWLQEHGKLWVRHADALGLKRYTQLHDWPDHPLCTAWRQSYAVSGQPYDGVSTAYWPSYQVLVDALDTRPGQAAMAEILEHERSMIDTANSMLAFGIVHPVINPRGRLVASEESHLFRCVYFPEGQPHYSREQIQRHWIAVHAGLSHEFSASSPNKRYHQVHALDLPLADRLRDDRGMRANPRHFGHAEAWSCQSEFDRAAADPGRAELFPLFLADIDAFCDRSRGYFLVGKEFSLVDEDIYGAPLPRPEDFWPRKGGVA